MTDDYFYLAGPMTGYPQFNFPAFDRAAAYLRRFGNRIVSPAELDDPVVREWAISSEDGENHSEEDYLKFLRRDANIVMDPRCKGVICLPGWQASRGALMETYLCETFGKPIYEITEDCSMIRQINRSEEVSA